jgi:hypothetical protein
MDIGKQLDRNRVLNKLHPDFIFDNSLFDKEYVADHLYRFMLTLLWTNYKCVLDSALYKEMFDGGLYELQNGRSETIEANGTAG